ncbi:MAG TPA: alcohol dehydrogenase catalytic domain-containing protein [Aurantimonas sp.]|nr:alcohol dehydrogenase catalytic domain-containing protein [Aurantimonas sp.]
MAASDAGDGARTNLRWAHKGGSLDDLLDADPEAVALPGPAADEVIARVEAVSICSSDIKVVRMGADHPLLARAASGEVTVLGHEMSLRVEDVGTDQADRYHVGQRLALQPAMRIDGRRRIIGFDVPGGFAQYLRLGPEALAGYVFDAPEALTAAEIALLEPYGCVERAYRKNARTALKPEGSALVVLGPGSAGFGASRPLRWRRTVTVGSVDARLQDSFGTADAAFGNLADLGAERFDDIVALGEIPADELALLPSLLADSGMLLQARRTSTGPVLLDAARIHYDALALVGTREDDVLRALAPERQRFDARAEGVALVHGAGGAMGRIHVHRLLQLDDGPRVVIATSRKGARLADLAADFGPMASARGRRLIVTETAEVEEAVAAAAPGGLDDAVVVVPDSEAVAMAGRWLAPDGLLSVFAGFAYGRPIAFDLAGVAVSGKRITGSTGCTADDMKDVLARVLEGRLDLLANLKAVGGLKALPQALDAVNRGAVSGKIVIYPQAPDMPFRALSDGWRPAEEQGLTGGVKADPAR